MPLGSVPPGSPLHASSALAAGKPVLGQGLLALSLRSVVGAEWMWQTGGSAGSSCSGKGSGCQHAVLGTGISPSCIPGLVGSQDNVPLLGTQRAVSVSACG